MPARRIFAERLPSLVEPCARKTARPQEVLLLLVGFALGGEAGARLVKRLGMKASPSTLLRRLRGAKTRSFAIPEVIGVGDFAFLEGRRYGTIVVDPERGRPVELLPDRSAETLAAWLKEHPEITTISRDRSTEYERAVKEGAPQAAEVLDRWHLPKNLREATQRMLERNWKKIVSAAGFTDENLKGLPPLPRGVSERIASEADREQRLERYEQVRGLRRQGSGIPTISRLLGMSRGAVREYVRSESFPERPKHPRRPSMPDPFEPYLLGRWQQGCRNALQPYREIKEQGYPGGQGGVLRWARRRRDKPAPSTPGRYLTQEVTERCRKQSAKQTARASNGARDFASPRRAVWLLLARSEDLDAEERQVLGQLVENPPEVATAHRLVQRFTKMVRQKVPEDFGRWLEDVMRSGLADFESFAAGLEREQGAVEAALREPWSNGQVEGHISRLKFIKRQMYGRASFELLRRRVLNAA